MRPGEKLTEELFGVAEPMTQSPLPGIMIAAPRPSDGALLGRAIESMLVAAGAGDDGRAVELLRRLVGEPAHQDQLSQQGLQRHDRGEAQGVAVAETPVVGHSDGDVSPRG